MRKRKRRDKSNYKKIALYIELLFLAVMVFLIFMFYQMKRNQLELDASGELQELQTGVIDVIETKQGSMEEISCFLAKARSCFGSVFAQSDYGIVLEFFDSDGNVIDKRESDNHVCTWTPLISNEEGYGDTEWYDLNTYFQQEDLDILTDYYKQAANENNWMEIEAISGYYQNGQFRPVEIIFRNGDQENQLFRLRNDQLSSKINVVRMEEYVNAENFLADNIKIIERGMASAYMDNTRSSVKNKTQELLSENGVDGKKIVNNLSTGAYTQKNKICIYNRTANNDQIAGFALAAYIDVNHMTWHSSEFWRHLLVTLIFCQILAGIFIIVYCYIGKRQQQLEEMRNTFINAIAHEMKTPAAVIKNCMEYLEVGTQQEKREYYRQAAIQESDHLNELLNSMLVYTRISDSSCEINKQECNVSNIIKKILEHYQTKIEQKHILIQLNCNDHACIHADEKLIKMVFDNMISNAVKFCRPGGSIKISADDSVITIFNEGAAIAQEQIDHIWEPLYRGDEARSDEDGSSGMGLAICENILKLHGFNYGVKNAADGVEFWFDVKERERRRR